MNRGKPTQGIGSPKEPPSRKEPPSPKEAPLDDESGVKAGLSRRHTHRGLGDSQAPKLVTMHGVAPPSDPPPPPSPAQPLGAPSAGRFFEQRSPQPTQPSTEALVSDSLRPPPVPHFDDDDTPDEGEFAPLSNQLGSPVDRSQFRTAPGGGKNRLSGGRAAASAYVSPSTLAPGHGAEPKVQSVEVDSRVIREARFHQTEPSLVRRRASQVPPEPTELPLKKASWLLPGLIALAVVGGLSVLAVLALQPTAPTPKELAAQARAAEARRAPSGRPSAPASPLATSNPTVTPPVPSAPAAASASSLEPAPLETTAQPQTSSVDPTNSRNPASQRPTTPHAEHSSHPPGSMSSPSPSAAPRSTKSTAAPKSTAAGQPATAPNRDLWIE